MSVGVSLWVCLAMCIVRVSLCLSVSVCLSVIMCVIIYLSDCVFVSCQGVRFLVCLFGYICLCVCVCVSPPSWYVCVRLYGCLCVVVCVSVWCVIVSVSLCVCECVSVIVYVCMIICLCAILSSSVGFTIFLGLKVLPVSLGTRHTCSWGFLTHKLDAHWTSPSASLGLVRGSCLRFLLCSPPPLLL